MPNFTFLLPKDTVENWPYMTWIVVSEDKQSWGATYSTPIKSDPIVTLPISRPHTMPSWENIRQYIIKELLPSLEEPKEYNDLDRFTNLE